LRRLPEAVILDLSAILAFVFEGDRLHPNAERLMNEVEKKKTSVYVSDATPYEAEALFLSGRTGVPLRSWTSFVSRLWQDPLFPRLPTTARVFAEHLRYYRGTGGRLTYFDSFHAATSRVSGIPLVTPDGELLSEKSIGSIDLAEM
jgi:predicted nucleic acid-binding protein